MVVVAFTSKDGQVVVEENNRQFTAVIFLFSHGERP
jgi:hypothetical protein